MEILVCVKRVPDTAENEIEVAGDGNDIERDDLVYSVNEWDNYAVEEAIQIVDKVGGSVTIVSVGDEDAEDHVGCRFLEEPVDLAEELREQGHSVSLKIQGRWPYSRPQ